MKTAVVQLNARTDKRKNIVQAVDAVKRAIRAKAQFILLPEVFNYRGPLGRDILMNTVDEGIPGESTIPLMALARTHKAYILAGSIYERRLKDNKVYNTSILINPFGKITARYRKRHLFNAVIGRRTIKESKVFAAGRSPAVARVKGFSVGMSICYDLRFPEQFRGYSRQGCHLLTVPSSFTKETGKAHWEILLRARAVENLCYVLAPNQTGHDGRGLPTYGNSMIISPWGEILARASEKRQEVIYADITMAAVKQARAVLPVTISD